MSDSATKERVVSFAGRERKPLFPIDETALALGETALMRRVLVKSEPWEAPQVKVRGLLKSDDAAKTEAPSKQGVVPGVKEHEFDMRAMTTLDISNIHHATCIEAKVASTVGIGFENDKVAKILNPLCAWSFQDVLLRLCYDYWKTGNAYLEVVRDKASQEITGLHWLPSYEVKLVVEDEFYNMHYIVQGRETVGWRIFAKYGDLADFMTRKPMAYGFSFDPSDDSVRIGEVIHIARPNSLSRWYGWPDSISAVSSIELVQCLKQHEYDFFNNRGVPEFLLFLLGDKVADPEWKELLNALKANIGLGNSHKSAIVNLTGSNLEVILHKLAIDGKTDGLFAELAGILAHEIVSAHGVPPLLAGIQIPGKLGATNELPNALVAFQCLKIGPAQHQIETILDQTLGDPKLNGGLALKEGDFKLKCVTQQVDIAAIDTAARMQDEVASPEGQARMKQVAAGSVQSSGAGTKNGTIMPATSKNGAAFNPYLKKAMEQLSGLSNSELLALMGR